MNKLTQDHVDLLCQILQDNIGSDVRQISLNKGFAECEHHDGFILSEPDGTLHMTVRLYNPNKDSTMKLCND